MKSQEILSQQGLENSRRYEQESKYLLVSLMKIVSDKIFIILQNIKKSSEGEGNLDVNNFNSKFAMQLRIMASLGISKYNDNLDIQYHYIDRYAAFFAKAWELGISESEIKYIIETFESYALFLGIDGIKPDGINKKISAMLK